MNDQPERRSNLELGNGNSSIHTQFGYLIDIQQVQSAIRSCELCSKSIFIGGKFTERNEVKHEV
jgi:hypothetical protein